VFGDTVVGMRKKGGKVFYGLGVGCIGCMGVPCGGKINIRGGKRCVGVEGGLVH